MSVTDDPTVEISEPSLNPSPSTPPKAPEPNSIRGDIFGGITAGVVALPLADNGFTEALPTRLEALATIAAT